jgi:valyl-tRNA synthetase
LSNEAFVAKAPDAVIGKEREKLAEYKNQLVTLQEQQTTIQAL